MSAIEPRRPRRAGTGRCGLFAACAGFLLAACIAMTGGALASTVPPPRSLRDIAYGKHSRQRFDLHLPASSEPAPVIVIVHGGAWARGDKDHPGLIPAKAAHWGGCGLALLSLNYRLVPDATPLDQATDVARALAEAARNAGAWNLDMERVVLLGHSAGAHVAALLAASPDLLREAGAPPVRGAILLDSAAWDVEQLMRQPHPALYDRAFGEDPALWRAASPYARLSPGAAPMLAVCSTRHLRAACTQARRFAARAEALGARVEVLPVSLGHMDINRRLGESSGYTRRVDAFISSVTATGSCSGGGGR